MRIADVRCRRVFRIWSRPLLQGSGLLSVDKRDSEPGPAVWIGALKVRRSGNHCALVELFTGQRWFVEKF